MGHQTRPSSIMASKPLGLVLIVTAHMVLTGLGDVHVTGILGSNVTLTFKFNITIKNYSSVAIYRGGETKIDESTSCGKCFEIFDDNVSYSITHLRQNQSAVYSATVFSSKLTKQHSNRVILTVENRTRTITVPPTPTALTDTPTGNSSYSLLIPVLVVSSVVLSATILPLLICCVMKTKDQLRQQPQQSSNPTLQETIDVPANAAAPSTIYSTAATPSVIYSVLDFPKRPPTVVELNPNDTEYAAVSYLPETRKM
ncbi:uncharacterized protein LOC114434507 [Parambassis ranga]|uniref:Uncharacterized protein LOC114434507 n=1 Tax=Parambassis ranga TaxID=210632 RepID=A0A6P7IGY6_9TELE|nr:uncharacterized protein LOC114434507 [Parambassis ranga]